ncbi:putative receptor-type adenylate cyclase [Trypanosoma grayi]|uniref:putative receptor-type adenylate cyclase n=1 Tax=Trypanosoma grayi TaxID=71804 RepID=UPI0004F441D3|nr:putative receptor-type adenylate cyclase [Trypanosoma grayi]KEG11328.1 putative receptor-type adenylate cyclase [Trypanosoma grayi]
MYQLNAVPGRTFAALRLDRQDASVNVDGDGSCSEAATDVSMGSLCSAVEGLSDFIGRCFSRCPAAERVELLKPLCRRWGVRLVGRRRGMSDVEYAATLTRCLAARMNAVRDSAAASPRGRGFSPTLAGCPLPIALPEDGCLSSEASSVAALNFFPVSSTDDSCSSEELIAE